MKIIHWWHGVRLKCKCGCEVELERGDEKSIYWQPIEIPSHAASKVKISCPSCSATMFATKFPPPDVARDGRTYWTHEDWYEAVRRFSSVPPTQR